jgi:hypothetical protein
VFLGAVVAGNRFGKTHINIVDALIQTLPYELVPPWLHRYKVKDPAQREVLIRFIGPDLDHWLERAVLTPSCRISSPVTLCRAASSSARAAPGTPAPRSSPSPTGPPGTSSRTTWSSMPSPRSSWTGHAFDEEPTGIAGERIYDETIRGLADREGDIRFTLTPVEGIGWLFSELSDEDGEPRQDDETWVVQGDIDHNPHLSEKGKAPGCSNDGRSPVSSTSASEDSGSTGRDSSSPSTSGVSKPDLSMTLQEVIFELIETYGPEDQGAGGIAIPVSDRRFSGSGESRLRGHRPRNQRRPPLRASSSPSSTRPRPTHGREDVLEVFFASSRETRSSPSRPTHHEPSRRARLQAAVHGDRPGRPEPQPGDRRKLQEAFRREGIHTILGQNDRALTYAEVRGRLVDSACVIWRALDAARSATSSPTTAGSARRGGRRTWPEARADQAKRRPDRHAALHGGAHPDLAHRRRCSARRRT